MARPTILIGPPVAQMTREAAVQQLKGNPKFPKEAEVEIQQHAGHWIAAFVEKEAAPFGGPADDGEESAGPKSEGPDDASGGDEGGAPSPDDGGSDDGGEDGPPKKKKPGEGGGLDAIVHQLADTVNAIAQALGVPPVGMGGGGLGPDSLDGGPGGPPGMDGPPGMGGPPGPPAPPHGHGGPPMPPHGGPAGPMPQKVMHEKAGPPPPQTFSSAQHPWGHMVGQTRFFVVAEEIGNDSYESVEHELKTLAHAGGFRLARFTPLQGQQGERAVQAVIETPHATQ